MMMELVRENVTLEREAEDLRESDLFEAMSWYVVGVVETGEGHGGEGGERPRWGKPDSIYGIQSRPEIAIYICFK